MDRDHLIQPFNDGGHGFEEDGYPVTYMNHENMHEEDHDPAAWWARAITHAHVERLWYFELVNKAGDSEGFVPMLGDWQTKDEAERGFLTSRAHLDPPDMVGDVKTAEEYEAVPGWAKWAPSR